VHIAVYYPWIYLTSGVERVILEIYKRSKHKQTIFTNHFDRDNTYPEFQHLNVIQLPRISVNRTMKSVFNVATTIAFQRVNFNSFDCLFVHCDGLGDLILNRHLKIPAVSFCHTPLRPIFDDQYRLRVLGRYKGLIRLAFHFFSFCFKMIDRRKWSRYHYIFFNSQETALRAEKGGLLRDRQGEYEVLHPGIDWNLLQPSWNFEPYFLLPGRIMWTKNIELAIQAFLRFKGFLKWKHFRLVIAGRIDNKSKPYLQELQRMTMGRDDVEFIMSPTDYDLWNLYSNCYAVLFPAFNEDWGIVPLEANAFGKPVVATNSGGPKESQINGKTGFLVSSDPEGFSKAMTRLAEDKNLVRVLGHNARDNARKYHWTNFVNRIDAVLEEVDRKNF